MVQISLSVVALFCHWFVTCWSSAAFKRGVCKAAVYSSSKKDKIWLFFFSVVQWQSEQVRDRNNNKATHMRYWMAGHRSVSSRDSDPYRMSRNKAHGTNVHHDKHPRLGNIPLAKRECVTVNSSNLVGFLSVDSFASWQLLFNLWCADCLFIWCCLCCVYVCLYSISVTLNKDINLSFSPRNTAQSEEHQSSYCRSHNKWIDREMIESSVFWALWAGAWWHYLFL